MAPETIDQLLDVAASTVAPEGRGSPTSRIPRCLVPLLVALAETDGAVAFADDLGAGIGHEVADGLARDVAKRLAASESCQFEHETSQGPRLVLAVRLLAEPRDLILFCMVQASAAEPGWCPTDTGALVSAAFAWAAVHCRTRNAEVTARMEQLTAGQQALRASYSRAMTRAIEERDERLREHEEHAARLEAVMTTAAEGIVTIDEHGVIESFNTAASDIFGYAPEEVIGQNVSILMPDPDRENHCRYIAQYLHGPQNREKPASREVIARRKDGTTFPLELAVSEVALNNATVFTGILRDITERRMLENQLVQAQKLESIGQLAAGIAHEINTPTQFIGDNMRFLEDAFSDLVPLLEKNRQLQSAANKEDAAEGPVAEIVAAARDADLVYLVEEIPKAIAQCLEGVDRVAHIVRSMKEFSHPGGDEMQPVDLNRALESTLTVCRNEWKYVADVVTEFDPALPMVNCLPAECNQVFLNLIINAAHAIAEKQKQGATDKGTITVSTRCHQRWVEVRVADTGTGIPERFHGKVFDPFFTTKEVGRGTGQGLAIARSVLTEKHGGTLSFETEVGRGTTFIVQLPRSA